MPVVTIPPCAESRGFAIAVAPVAMLLRLIRSNIHPAWPHLIKLRRTAAVARCVLTSMHAKLAEVRSYEHRWYHGREARKTSCAMCSSAPVRPGARVPRPRRGVCAPGVAKFATQKISKIVPGELSLRSGTAGVPSYFGRRTRSRSHWRPTIRNSSTRHSACVEKTWLTCVASSNRTSLEM